MPTGTQPGPSTIAPTMPRWTRTEAVTGISRLNAIRAIISSPCMPPCVPESTGSDRDGRVARAPARSADGSRTGAGTTGLGGGRSAPLVGAERTSAGAIGVGRDDAVDRPADPRVVDATGGSVACT